MTAITENQFSKLVGGYGFDTFEGGAFEQFENSISSLVQQSLSQVPAQAGGRVAMPSEYFGVDQNTYTTNTNGSNPSYSQVTDVLARGGLEQTFPHVGGGATIDGVFESALKAFRKQFGQSGGAPKKLKKEQKDRAKSIFRGAVDKLFLEIRAVAKKTNKLTEAQMKRVLKKFYKK